MKSIKYTGLALTSLMVFAACQDDFLENDPTRFSSEEDVNKTMQLDPSNVQAYVTGAYFNLYCGGDYRMSHDDFGLPAIKLATDLNCEDIAYPRDQHFFCYDYQLDNRLKTYRRTNSMWNQLYNVIDNSNTIITMLKPAEGEDPSSDEAKIMLGEAYTLRAYCYFWLINLYQHPYSVDKNAPGVPLKTETVYRQERVPVGEIYDQILADIDLGYTYLKGEGFFSGNGALSEYSAAAIYANILLFTGDYAKAASYAEIAATSKGLNSKSEMLSGFNSLDMTEVIWGYNVNNETTGYYASLFSHIDSYMIGYGGNVGFRKEIASALYDEISDDDIRKQWFGYNDNYNLLSVSYDYEESYSDGTDSYDLTTFIQNKYRDIYLTSMGNADPFTSAIIYFRSGEMYFVAAEAYYLAGNNAKAKEMLETVMSTRIDGYTADAAGRSLYDEIKIQKRIETFMEGDRYLDVKRRGETIDRSASINHAADVKTVFDAWVYEATDYRMIYQIPTKELENNPSINDEDQNP